MLSLPSEVLIEEEALRDGLQNEKRTFSIDEKLHFIQGLEANGVRRIQVGSFVHPKWVPQMADTDELVTQRMPVSGVVHTALVLNLKGVERALAVGARHLSMSISAGETHSLRNTNRTFEEAKRHIIPMIETALFNGIQVRAGIQSALDSIPIVVIAGNVPSHYYGKHPHQEVNLHADASQYEIYRPFVKRAWRVDTPELFPEILERAFTLAESGQPGPVLVDVPMDVFSAKIDVALFDRLRHNAKSLVKPSIDEETAARIVRTLAEAKSPLLYVGGGIALAQATQELEALVDHLNIAVAHTLMGKGMLRDDHPFTLGMTGFWGTQFINDKCLKADWILALGARFKEADSSSWYRDYTFNIPPTKLIHIDIEPSEIGRNFPTEIGVVADLKAVLATAREEDLGVIWVVMNNNAFGAIAGLQKAHYGLTYGTVFPTRVSHVSTD